ncbi:spermatogenesis associated 6-like protein [Amblyraja radiata]|uniref:spermatogenesis associated 6-like protein n=1 Tax=Amblyraja radiata TaxID=386614 RepID=UPI0014028D3A|nr:spermatogenesis associated 6-like protein [Amblyraja radiata]XP_032873707.1 spermatogenesis associated 6-like protein [Amblyraja radiata]XP_032873708.1 spermatogenesis associated 6-like protein [Amblyraja radiata]XP_032873709.1 spermatogenesis associated 6-like protein [Amblyraja radiata]
MPQKVLKCVIQLEIHAITCPGVILPRKDDVYLCIYILGQRWKTKCVIPVFPLLIHEKLQFEKVFGKDIIDPADVAAFLECDDTKFELVQFTPSVNETLASYEDNTRNFLFPEPKLTPSYPGVDREVLMRRCSTVFLISPKLEFSTTTTITEFSPRSTKRISSSLCLSENGRKENQIRRPRCAKSFNLIGRSCTERRSDKEPKKPLTLSRSRSLSPYCRRCLLELCRDDTQHPPPQKSESISRRPIMIETCDRRKSEKYTSPLSSLPLDKSPRARPRTASPARCNRDVCLPRYSADKSSSFREPVSWEELSKDTEDLISYPLNSTLRDNSNVQSSPSICSQRKAPSNINRLYFDPVSHPAWDRIHEKVQNLLASIDAQEKASARNVNFTCSSCS